MVFFLNNMFLILPLLLCLAFSFPILFSSSHIMSNLTITACGSTLSIPQRLAIRTSLLKIKLNESLNNIKFWGKIQGTTQDYFLASSCIMNTTVNKLYYWR